MSGTFIFNSTPGPEGGFRLEFAGFGTTLRVVAKGNAEIIARSYLANRLNVPPRKIKLNIWGPK